MNFITKTNLSTTCDFGAQMLEYAGMYAVGKHTQHEPVFIKETIGERWAFPIGEPFVNSPKIINYSDVPPDNFYQYDVTTKDYNIDKTMYYLNKENNWVINGGVGVYEYFHPIREEILKLFTFKENILEFCTNYINQLKKDDEIFVSVHFRRGDYLVYSSLNLSLNYYNAAIQKIKNTFLNKKIKYLIFSNEIEWVKNNYKNKNFIFVENLNRFQDMCLMSLCDHNIIANSCFSWWGAYLNKNINKTVIAPFHYVGENDNNSLNLNGRYYPKEWISLYEK
jgi:hypothetical protein